MRLVCLASLLALAAVLAGCWDPATCYDVAPERLAEAPRRLSETGLYADVAGGVLAPGVVPYTPGWELWSDGAEKRRWIRVPPGEAIDTADMDDWQFPVGTKVWKEFVRDGVRIETRFLGKYGPDPSDWVAVAYLWDADGREAWRCDGGLANARGTEHDVPPAGACQGCHEGTRSRVLGFSAIQLAHDAPEGEATLKRLSGEGRLSHPPAAEPALPGDEATRAALGYLHANCAHCHNQHRPPGGLVRCWNPWRDFDLSLRTDQLGSVEATPVYRTALEGLVVPGKPDESTLLTSMHSRGEFRARMPPLAVEVEDVMGEQALRAWIEGLRAEPRERR